MIDTERFVFAIVAGGIALAGGLWLVELVPATATAWWAGIALVVAGCCGLAAGIWSQLDVR